MTITSEEREEIINQAVERALLKLPEVIGNLIMNQANNLRINKEFYSKFPELMNSKDIVASVVEEIENKYPGTDYKSILDKALPTIRERINLTKSLNNNPSKPNRIVNGVL
jgi:hypothetical protein